MMFKSFIFLSFFLISLNADYLYSKNDTCINDFYYKSGTFYYHYSKDGNDTWHHTTNNNYIKYIRPGFIYDSDNDICRMSDISLKLGLWGDNYEFLMGLSGFSLGYLLIFTMSFFIRS